MLLIDRDILSCAIYLGCGGDDYPACTAVLCGLTHVERAGDVCVDITFRGYITVGNGNQGGQMKNRVDIACYMSAERCIAHVAAYYFKFGMMVPFEPSPVVE